MGLPETGVRLVAENERGFLAALDRSTRAVDSFQQGAGRASVGTIALGTAVGNLMTGGLSILAETATRAGKALTGLVTQGVQEAAALESQMSAIGAVTGASADQMESLQDLILDLGLDPNLTVSTVEAAQAIEMLGKNGVSVNEILDGMALSTVQLANATGADFATAADLSTDVMAIFSREGLEMGEAVNGITGVVNSSKFDINDFALALANGGSVAAATGVEFGDFTDAIAATAFNFSSGQTAGTAFRNLLTRLTPSTEKAGDEMRALGLITDEAGNRFFDSEGNLKDMNSISQVLSEALAGLSEAQKSATLETIFGADASAAAIAMAQVGETVYTNVAGAMDELGISFEDATALVDAGGTQFALTALQMDKVNAGDSAATRVDNFSGAMDILGGIVEGIRIQIGDKFLPILTDMARKFSELVEANAQPIIDFFGNFTESISFLIEQISTGAPMLETMSGFLAKMGVSEDVTNSIVNTTAAVIEFIGGVGEFVTEHKETFIGAIKGIGAALAGAAIAAAITSIVTAIGALLSPIGLIIATAALLGAAWENNWGGIQEKTAAVIAFITPVITGAITFIKEFWAENGDAILTKASEIWTGIGEAINTSLIFIRDEVITPITIFILELWNTHGDAIIERTTAIWNFVTKFISLAFDNVKILFDAFRAAFDGDWRGFGENIRKIWFNIWEIVKLFFSTFVADFKVTVSTFISDVIAKFTETDWGQVGGDIIDGIRIGFINASLGLVEAARGVATAVTEATKGVLGIESPSKVFAEIGKNMGQGMAMGLDSERGVIASAGSGLGQTAVRAIAPPASANQILNTSNTSNTNNTVNFTGNFANQPSITDRDALVRAMATI